MYGMLVTVNTLQNDVKDLQTHVQKLRAQLCSSIAETSSEHWWPESEHQVARKCASA